MSLFIIGHMGLFFYTKKGSIISTVDLPTTEIIEPKYTVQNCYSSTFVFVEIYFYVSENISISVLAFFILRRKIMQKNEQSSRQIVMCHLMAIMRIDINKAKRIVAEMEENGLIQFDELGNIGLLVLEGQS